MSISDRLTRSQPNITLLSLKELVSQIFDVRHALRELVEDYEGEQIFHDYLPLKVETHEWSKAAKSLKVREFAPLMKEVVDFDGQQGIGVMLVLADFGAGKTTLLQHVAYQRARAHLEGEDTRLPLFVALRDFSDSQDLSTLLRDSFHGTYLRDLPRRWPLRDVHPREASGRYRKASWRSRRFGRRRAPVAG